MTQQVIDKNVLNVVTQYAERAQKGFQKYGTTTERTDIDLFGWLQHLQEELMDATVYIERLKHELKQQSSNGAAMPQAAQSKNPSLICNYQNTSLSPMRRQFTPKQEAD